MLQHRVSAWQRKPSTRWLFYIKHECTMTNTRNTQSQNMMTNMRIYECTMTKTRKLEFTNTNTLMYDKDYHMINTVLSWFRVFAIVVSCIRIFEIYSEAMTHNSIRYLFLTTMFPVNLNFIVLKYVKLSISLWLGIFFKTLLW